MNAKKKEKYSLPHGLWCADECSWVVPPLSTGTDAKCAFVCRWMNVAVVAPLSTGRDRGKMCVWMRMNVDVVAPLWPHVETDAKMCVCMRMNVDVVAPLWPHDETEAKCAFCKRMNVDVVAPLWPHAQTEAKCADECSCRCCCCGVCLRHGHRRSVSLRRSTRPCSSGSGAEGSSGPISLLILASLSCAIRTWGDSSFLNLLFFFPWFFCLFSSFFEEEEAKEEEEQEEAEKRCSQTLGRCRE